MSIDASLRDNDLLRRAGEGDRIAFAELYDNTASRTLGVIIRVLRDRAQSEEVCQDVFLEVWQTASRFDADRGKALNWILTMAHRRAIDRVRASQASRDRDLKIGQRDYDDHYDDVQESVVVRSEHARALKVMERLSDLQREAIDLAYTHGLTQNEIAVRLGIPVGTVKTRLRDGLIRLREGMAS